MSDPLNNIFGIVRVSTSTDKINKIILKDVKKNKFIIYGRQAMNKQLPGFMRAYTEDYDIITPKNKYKSAANNMKDKLNCNVAGGRKWFYTKPALHPGTQKLMYIGNDLKKGTQDDINIADYSAPSFKLKTVNIDGIKYQTLSSIKSGKKKILKDPESKFRHEKDRTDLKRISASKIF